MESKGEDHVLEISDGKADPLSAKINEHREEIKRKVEETINEQQEEIKKKVEVFTAKINEQREKIKRKVEKQYSIKSEAERTTEKEKWMNIFTKINIFVLYFYLFSGMVSIMMS